MLRGFLVSGLALPVLVLLGCSSDEGDAIQIGGGNSPGSGGALVGSGGQTVVLPGGGAAPTAGTNGGGGTSGTGECVPSPVGLLRDFNADHPDFEFVTVAEKGIVAPDLDVASRKPVFANTPGLRSVHTAAEFDQWYRDVPGVNMTQEYEINFTTSPTGTAVYDNPAFFPIDGQMFGNEGRDHNFHFTFELHMTFRFTGSEVFRFRGDDDVFVFINNKLAIDLGGVHKAQSQEIDLAQQATALGITVGQEYPIDFFQAERHTTESNFRIETNLNFTNCTPILIR